MANRLSKIVTRTGDDGSTGLASGGRVSKGNVRIAALGDVDELNSAMGVLLAETLPTEIRDALSGVQQDLFDLGGELSLPGHALMTEAHLARIERQVIEFNAPLPPLKEFILPGGSRPAALAHVARTVCRRAERAVVVLHEAEPLSPLTMQYLNRLSDLLFVLSRVLNRSDAGSTDTLWQQGRNRG